MRSMRRRWVSLRIQMGVGIFEPSKKSEHLNLDLASNSNLLQYYHIITTMTTIAPNKVILTCTVTGKQTTWTNKQIIQKKIDQFGSLEAFMAQYVSKGANKTVAQKVQEPKMMKKIFEQGVMLGKMTQEEYNAQYVTKQYTFKDGTTCTVAAPKPAQPTQVSAPTNTHAASNALKAVKESI